MTNIKQKLPSLIDVKKQASGLRAGLTAYGTTIPYSKSLELIARQFGFKDWNTLHAAIESQPPVSAVNVGDNINGRYLGQPFTGEVLAIHAFKGANRFRLTLNLEEPVDVVTFDSFSSFRKRINCTVDHSGISAGRTSNGEPQMILELE